MQCNDLLASILQYVGVSMIINYEVQFSELSKELALFVRSLLVLGTFCWGRKSQSGGVRGQDSLPHDLDH